MADGRVVAVGPELAGPAREEIDARGLLVLPGVRRRPRPSQRPRPRRLGGVRHRHRRAGGGRDDVRDRHAAQRGPADDRRARRSTPRSRRRTGVAHVDVALWGGLVPGDRDRLDELAARGVVGFKAFMSASGVEEFEAADDLTLLEGMARAARLGLPVAVHAESEELTRRLGAPRGGRGARRHARLPGLAARRRRARGDRRGPSRFAAETGCALHVVHVSSGRGVALVAQARARGVDVTCETCPHYLVLDEDDAERLGAVAKCAPPLRARRRARGAVGGAARRRRRPRRHRPLARARRAQGGRRLLRGLGRDRGRPDAAGAALRRGRRGAAASTPATLAELLAAAPARRFGLAPAKGALAVGADADVALVDPAGTWTVAREDLLDRHRLSPFVGRRAARPRRAHDPARAHGRARRADRGAARGRVVRRAA